MAITIPCFVFLLITQLSPVNETCAGTWLITIKTIKILSRVKFALFLYFLQNLKD